MKYIMFETVKDNRKPIMIVFPKCIEHYRIAEAIAFLREGSTYQWERASYTPVSAGFTDGTACFGRSETLNL